MPTKDRSQGKSSFKHQAVSVFEELLDATKVYRREYYDWGRIAPALVEFVKDSLLRHRYRGQSTKGMTALSAWMAVLSSLQLPVSTRGVSETVLRHLGWFLKVAQTETDDRRKRAVDAIEKCAAKAAKQAKLPQQRPSQPPGAEKASSSNSNSSSSSSNSSSSNSNSNSNCNSNSSSSSKSSFHSSDFKSSAPFEVVSRFLLVHFSRCAAVLLPSLMARGSKADKLSPADYRAAALEVHPDKLGASMPEPTRRVAELCMRQLNFLKSGDRGQAPVRVEDLLQEVLAGRSAQVA